MNVIYRVFREENGQYAFREVFTEYDGQIITYSQSELAPIGGSLDDLAMEVASLQDALTLPVLTTAELDAQIAQRKRPENQGRKSISHSELLAKLGLDTDEQDTAAEFSISGRHIN